MLLGRLSISVSLTRSIYYAYFHSIIKNVIIFRVTLPTVGRFFTSKKQIVRIMAGVQPRTSCRSLFTQIEILCVRC